MAFRWAEPIKCYSGSIALPVKLTAQLSPTRGVGETANPSRKTISALYSTLPDVAGCSALSARLTSASPHAAIHCGSVTIISCGKPEGPDIREDGVRLLELRTVGFINLLDVVV
jgi:hypothetical protein